MRERSERLHEALVGLRQKLRAAEDRLKHLDTPSLPSRIGRRVVGGLALTLAEAVAKANAGARVEAEVNGLRSEVDRREREIEVIRHQREDKLGRIRDSQRDFSRLACFDLGFSHEVLNVN